MLVERFKEITEDKGWSFAYGRDHWQNLADSVLDDELSFADRMKYVKLLWKDRQHKIDQYGTTYGYTFFGDLLLLVRSKLSDPSYEYKYETHIKNLEALSKELKDGFDMCDVYVVKSWKETEVSDVYDENMDGLKISFTIEFK